MKLDTDPPYGIDVVPPVRHERIRIAVPRDALGLLLWYLETHPITEDTMSHANEDSPQYPVNRDAEGAPVYATMQGFAEMAPHIVAEDEKVDDTPFVESQQGHMREAEDKERAAILARASEKLDTPTEVAEDSPRTAAGRVALLALQRAEQARSSEEMQRYAQVALTAAEIAVRI